MNMRKLDQHIRQSFIGTDTCIFTISRQSQGRVKLVARRVLSLFFVGFATLFPFALFPFSLRATLRRLFQFRRPLVKKNFELLMNLAANGYYGGLTDRAV